MPKRILVSFSESSTTANQFQETKCKNSSEEPACRPILSPTTAGASKRIKSSMVDPLAYAQSYKGKNRNKIGKDLDQALFLVGACFEGSGMKVTDTLDNANFKPHPALPDLLKWFQTHSNRDEVKRGASIAAGIYNDWLSKADNRKIAVEQQLLFGIEG